MLINRIFNGNDAVYGLTVNAVDEAVKEHGADKPVGFPHTAYCLPCYYAVTGVKVKTLGELKEALVVTIALKIRNPFYKLIALGLGTEYAFQVFLTIGGATKFIPMTGVTLPLVSYGGSSVMCTILMLAIIQGLYILREDEDEQIETQRKETIERRGKRATPERKRNRQTP